MNNYKLFFIFLVISNLVFSQTSGILKGTVKEEGTNEALYGASIRKVNDLSIGTKTDINGNYSIELPEGNHILICGFIGLGSDTFSVVIQPGETTIRDVYLSEIKEVLETVVVSTSRYEQKLEEQIVSLEVMKPSAIENRNSTTIENAIEQVSGVSIIDGDPQIRGGSGFTFGVGSRVAIVVDDIPLLSGDAGKPEWSYIPIENIEQVEIIKGASSVLYGASALNGVIHIRTAYPRSTPKTVVNYSVGYYSPPKSPAESWYGNSIPGFTNLNFLHSRIIKKRLDFVIGANLNADQGYIGPAPAMKYMPQYMKEALHFDDSIPVYNNNDMLKLRARVNFNLRYRSEKIKGLMYGVNGNMMYNKTNMSFAWLDDSLGLYRSYPGALFMQRQILFNIDPFVKYYSPNGVVHSLITRIFRSDNEISNNQSNSGTMFYGEYQMKRQFKSIDLNFIGGVVGNISTSVAELYASSGEPYNRNSNFAGYLQLDKKFWQILNISGGVRYEVFQMNHERIESAPIFRVGANLQLTKGTFVRASYGQGYRFPSITERFIMTKAGLFGVFPNPELKPEKSSSFELGIKQGYMFGKFKGFIDIAGFYQRYENTIEYLFGVWDPDVTVVGFKFLNTGKSRVRGVEVSIVGMSSEENKKFGVTGLLGYTYVDPISLEPDYVYARDKSFGGSGTDLTYINSSIDTTGHTMKYRFNHMIKGDLEFRIYKFKLGFSYRYYSKMKNVDRAFQDIEIMTHDFSTYMHEIKIMDYWKNRNGFHIFDARLSYALSEKHKFSLICNNLFNNNYSLRPLKIEAPRTTSIQYILTL